MIKKKAFDIIGQMKRLLFIVLVFPAMLLHAQNITTASVFFSGVSAVYAKMSDYSASIKITQGGTTSVGTVKFKSPEMLRMDFSIPAEQTIVFTGSELVVYVPSNRTLLSQTVDDGGATTSNIPSSSGLMLMQRSYTIAYETGAEPIDLEEGSSEKVIALILNRRNANETFRKMRLLISPETLLIRRIEAWPISGNKITFDFTDYKVNAGIPDTAFIYTPPAGEIINNFLYTE